MTVPEREKCDFCGGDGWQVGMEHDPRCQGDCKYCPIPVQEMCEHGHGLGYVLVEHQED